MQAIYLKKSALDKEIRHSEKVGNHERAAPYKNQVFGRCLTLGCGDSLSHCAEYSAGQSGLSCQVPERAGIHGPLDRCLRKVIACVPWHEGQYFCHILVVDHAHHDSQLAESRFGGEFLQMFGYVFYAEKMDFCSPF